MNSQIYAIALRGRYALMVSACSLIIATGCAEMNEGTPVTLEGSSGAANGAEMQLTSAAALPVTVTAEDIVFETDFKAASNYQIGQVNGWNRDGAIPPTGWDAVRVGKEDSFIEVVNDGVDGAALALNYRGPGRASISLARHLTGSIDSGYDELYVRYNIKLPSFFKLGDDGRGLPFWKWGRLWQNTSHYLGVGNNWTENRDDSGYVVWTVSSGWGGNQGFSSAWSDNTVPGDHHKGSNGGPMQIARWYRAVDDVTSADGFFESVGSGAWALDPSRPGYLAVTDQTYHTIEWRFKLASSGNAEDGAFQIWIDGVELIPFTNMKNAYGAPERTGIPTVTEGVGWNHFSMFDNLQSWAIDWGSNSVDGYILIDDVVVSTNRIGHNYAPQGTTPTLIEE